MAKFSYELALKMDREVVLAHFRTASASSVSQALRRFREEGNDAVVKLITDMREAVRIERITATVQAKQQA